MDRETVLRIIGELYLNNFFLTQKNQELTQENDQLKQIIDQLQGPAGPNPVGSGVITFKQP